MPKAAPQIEELERAYALFEVPTSSSARVIKQAHHRMVKQWHPDLYPSGSTAQAEATNMMKLVNEAYALIEDAPLSRVKSKPGISWKSKKPASDVNIAETVRRISLNDRSASDWVELYGRILVFFFIFLYKWKTDPVTRFIATLVIAACFTIAYGVVEHYAARSRQRNATKPAGSAGLNTERIEFWVRFTCGALLGIVASFTILVNFGAKLELRVITALALAAFLTVSCGFLAAKDVRIW